jgi:hypothetical protein
MAPDGEQRSRRVVGILALAAGALGMAIANWGQPSALMLRGIAVLGGIVFLISGTLLLRERRTRIIEIGVVAILLCFVIIGAWISLFAPAVSFAEQAAAPTWAEVAMGRTLFGLGAILTSAILIGLLYRIFSRRK